MRINEMLEGSKRTKMKMHSILRRIVARNGKGIQIDNCDTSLKIENKME